MADCCLNNLTGDRKEITKTYLIMTKNLFVAHFNLK
jgi:hypothetical protein